MPCGNNRQILKGLMPNKKHPLVSALLADADISLVHGVRDDIYMLVPEDAHEHATVGIAILSARAIDKLEEVLSIYGSKHSGSH